MSRFYGSLNNDSGREATKQGTEKSGLAGHVRGFEIGAEISMSTNAEGLDVVTVYATGGSNDGPVPAELNGGIAQFTKNGLIGGKLNGAKDLAEAVLTAFTDPQGFDPNADAQALVDKATAILGLPYLRVGPFNVEDGKALPMDSNAQIEREDREQVLAEAKMRLFSDAPNEPSAWLEGTCWHVNHEQVPGEWRAIWNNGEVVGFVPCDDAADQTERAEPSLEF